MLHGVAVGLQVGQGSLKYIFLGLERIFLLTVAIVL